MAPSFEKLPVSSSSARIEIVLFSEQRPHFLVSVSSVPFRVWKAAHAQEMHSELINLGEPVSEKLDFWLL